MKEILPEVNPREKAEILETLNKFIKKYKKKRSFKRAYHKHYIIIWVVFIILTLIGVLLYLTFKKLIVFEFSVIFSVIAFITSFASLIPRIRGYPVDDLELRKINERDDYYELGFSIQNCGHGKLKLYYAFYAIEEIESDTELTSFLLCDIDRMNMYLEELTTRIQNDVIKVYSLKVITKKTGAFFTHKDIHTERRIHKFDRNKIYMISFLFWTSSKIFYYNSKYLKL